MARRLRHNEYTVAWICALPDELTAAHEMLDEVHQELPLSSIDMNTYKLGCIGKHNVVIVCPAPGQTDINAVAASARHLIVTFPAIRFGLMVGIGGGVPSKEADIRLGDVVVSQPGKGYSGVVQYNLEKSTLNSRFKCTGLLDSPPPILLTATAKLRSIQKQGRGSLLPHLLKLSNLDRFTYNKAGSDVLFEAEYTHIGGDNCVSCAATRQIQREERKNTTPMVHYGIIASGTQVIRNGAIRDQISSEFGEVLCFEMEAAGLTNNFPCLMIRGVCDYADSHKDKRWQAYAAGTAAAYAKELFLAIPTADVMKTQTIDKATRELGLKVVAEGVRPTVE
ncbi:purine and uridine phosphorylase [Viridothelium virens]|uniref:Purine and uridine phosphorylase n=1 Tax=Viridothelium virens TaxID=1048519 RepID=A0A6A6GTE7_VIRVR|nr:purine and uridine phosphorylase [Viridothelium virens]